MSSLKHDKVRAYHDTRKPFHWIFIFHCSDTNIAYQWITLEAIVYHWYFCKYFFPKIRRYVHMHCTSTLLKTSLKTKFVVADKGFFSMSWIKIFNPNLLLIVKVATHNSPWLKTGVGKYNPMQYKDYPWDLFMVIT